MNKYEISEQHLKDLMDKSSRTLVGKIMKRFEILKDNNAIKSTIKELVYENHRVLQELIKSFSTGVKFVTTPKKQKDSV